MKYINTFIIGISTFFSISCSNSSIEFQDALLESGKNRPELEKVINYFSKNSSDSLKLKASYFLIKNMKGHHSIIEPYIVKYYKQIDSQYGTYPLYIRNIFYNLPQYYVDLSKAKKTEDLRIIRSEFLINHIEKMFYIWENVPWKKNISFETFCEYILPYRLDTESVTTLMKNYYYFPIDSISQQLFEYDVKIDEFLYNYMWRILPQCNRESKLPNLITNNYIADCIWDSYRTLSECRLMCIPATIDFTPNWPHKNGRHYWNAIIDPCLVKKTFSENYIDRYAKVYRKTFSHNEIPHCNNRKTYIPPLFRTPFNKDVTDLYCKTADISLQLDNIKEDIPDYAYLSVFNELSWQPIAWGKTSKEGIASFQKMGLCCVYLPIYYQNNKEISGGYPFIIDPMKQYKKLIPNRIKLLEIHLTRKYPINDMAFGLNESLKNLLIETDNYNDFKQPKKFNLNKIENKPYQEIKFNPALKEKYWKVSLKNQNEKVQIAELFFYDQNEQPIDRNRIKLVKGIDTLSYNKLFDNNPLTYCTINDSIVISLGKDATISKIRYMPRNDDNNISPGNVYELFYRDLDSWISLGKKTAHDYFINFKNVPSNALYWLHNHTKGIEERIFTIENEKIEFW